MTLLLRAIVLVAFASALSATPSSAAIIKGRGAPQATGCVNAGGSMNGTMCDLPDGRSCEAMTFARDAVCMSEAGEILPPPDEDTGTNDGSDKSGDDAPASNE